MSALPKQVEAQLKEVEELEKQLMGPTGEAEVQTAESEPAPENEPAAQETQTTEPVAQPEVPAENWEAKYKALQGMFNAEMPKLQHQNRELLNQMESLKKQFEESQRKPEPVEDRLVTEKDEESFGADLIDVQRRVAKEVMREMVNPLKAELAKRDAMIARLEAAVGQTSGDVSAMTFEQQLERAIPGFAQINMDPKWISWLDELDQYGDPRRLRAEAAYNAGDINKLKVFVDLFTGKQGQQQVNQERTKRDAELQRQVQPSRTATASTVPQGDRFYTEAENTRLWNKVRELYSKGQNDEAVNLEAELSNAIIQGRIRG